MGLPLDAPVDRVAGMAVTPRLREALGGLAIRTVHDLILHLPRRHEDRRRFAGFPSQALPDPVCAFGVVSDVGVRRFGRRRSMVEAVLEAPGAPAALGSPLVLRWFHMPWIAKQLAAGQELVVYGKPKESGRRLVMDHPEFEAVERDEEASVHLDRLTPVYPLTSGVAQRFLRSLIYRALQQVEPADVPEILPDAGGDCGTRPARWETLRQVHFPETEGEAEAARRRLALEECFLLQLNVAVRRREIQSQPGACHAGPGELLERFLRLLPFPLTAAQRRAIEEIRRDLAEPRPMNRLLQGDVGSGKTFVALAAILLTVESGAQAALMAPTQVLADQHYLNFRQWLEPLGLRVSLRTAARREDGFLPLLNGGEEEPQIVIGTHALLYESAPLPRLGLAVIDEQHKFGVRQRAGLAGTGLRPDVLVLTATPIPRTLSLTLYGDLDVSVLDELPAGRGRVITGVRSLAKEAEAMAFVREKVAGGNRAYVVYPLVEESEKLRLQAAVTAHAAWREALGDDLPCALLHGRMSPGEKDAVMQAFRSGEARVLVCTTVIEVGVDVPEATVMLVMHAERFGLAQLHQLRGRVGRGSRKSYCVLLCAEDHPEAMDRLRILEETTDGFRIAEEDLRLRGPGDLLGTAQSGLPGLRLPSLALDARILHQARALAEDLLARDPALARPAHRNLRAYLIAPEENLSSVS